MADGDITGATAILKSISLSGNTNNDDSESDDDSDVNIQDFEQVEWTDEKILYIIRNFSNMVHNGIRTLDFKLL